MGVVLSVSAAAALLLIIYRLLAGRSRADVAYHLIRCPACAQKVRYPQERAGCTGMCPRCLRKLTLPEKAQPLAPALVPHRVGQRLLNRAG